MRKAFRTSAKISTCFSLVEFFSAIRKSSADQQGHILQGSVDCKTGRGRGNLTLNQNTNFGQFQIEKFDNFKFDKNGRKGRKHCGERQNCSLRAISPFPSGFLKDLYCRHLKTWACLGMG